MIAIILGVILIIIATFFLKNDPRLYRYAQTVRIATHSFRGHLNKQICCKNCFRNEKT